MTFYKVELELNWFLEINNSLNINLTTENEKLDKQNLFYELLD